MSKYTITLNDGSQLDGLTMNGTMFVSETEVTPSQLTPEALEAVTVAETDGETTTETHIENAVCDGILHWPEGWLFNLREPTAQEKKITALEQRLDEAEIALFELDSAIGGAM